MAQRISRAKQRIKASAVPIALPTPDEHEGRLRDVLRVLYLVFNEGHTASGGPELVRTDLADEAIRLGRMLGDLRPNDAEVTGLLSLMLLIDARRGARTDADGELVPLARQDRSRWDRARIAEGVALLAVAMRLGGIGEYVLQAVIAAIHDQTLDPAGTDWPQIAAIYGLLERMTDSPVVTLNRAVAVAMADGPVAGLDIVDSVATRLAGHYRLHSVRAYLLELAGDIDGAVAHYRAAAARTASLPERRYLVARATSLDAGRNVDSGRPAPTMGPRSSQSGP